LASLRERLPRILSTRNPEKNGVPLSPAAQEIF